MNKRRVALLWEKILSVLKYLLAIFMMLAGILTALAPIEPMSGNASFLFESRYALVFYGVTFFSSGFALFWGKIRKSRKWVGRGLLLIYLSFIFASVLNIIALGFGEIGGWFPNMGMALLVGILYLRWKFKTEYVDPKHFVRDLDLPNFKDMRHERH